MRAEVLVAWGVTLLAVWAPGCQSGPPMTLTEAERASEATLGPGDPAPEIAVSEWVKGEAASVPDPRHIVLLDFWATWCGPCRASMGRVSSLQERYGSELEVVAVTTVDSGNSVTAIRRHVASEGERMRFRVAIDEGSRTADAYRRAAREHEIPVAFLIDRDGRIAWIGHPVEVGPVVDAMIAGKWDVSAEAERRRRLARDRARAGPLIEDEKRAMRAGDTGAELKALDALCGLDPESVAWSPPYWLHSHRVDLLAGEGNAGAAIAAAEESLAIGSLAREPGAYAEMAAAVWRVDKERADRWASQALELLEERERSAGSGDDWDRYEAELTEVVGASVIQTVARVRYWQGRMEEAVRLQREAIARIEEKTTWREYAGMLKKDLATYEAAAKR